MVITKIFKGTIAMLVVDCENSGGEVSLPLPYLGADFVLEKGQNLA